MMEKRLLAILGGCGKRELEAGLEVRTLPALEILQARREAERYAGEDGQETALYQNACVLARAVYKDGARVFSSGEVVLKTLTAERIGRWMESYAALCREENPVCSEENAQMLKEQLRNAPQERFRWRVLREFGVLPTQAQARRMREGDYLYCAAQMMLDEEEKLEAMCPGCREKAQRMLCPVCGEEMLEVNAGFDEGRFEELKNAGIHHGAFEDAAENRGAV